MMQRGHFISFEGVDGAGKSTNISFATDLVRGWGFTVVQTREPGGTPVSEQIRELLLAFSTPPMQPLTELLLMFAARNEHLQQVIMPALERGNVVLCDRFTDATYAYQGGGRGLANADIEAIEKLVHAHLQPDLTLYFDLSVDASEKRQHGRIADRFEAEDVGFKQRVREAYLQRARQYSRVAVIDAARSLNQVQQDVERQLRRVLLPESQM